MVIFVQGPDHVKRAAREPMQMEQVLAADTISFFLSVYKLWVSFEAVVVQYHPQQAES